MSSAKLTLYGMNYYYSQRGQSLFDLLTVPEGLDKETLVDNILLRGAEFEVIYSDGDFMREAVGAWSRKWQRTMEKWITALSLEYNPIENYDRMEEWTTTDDGHVEGENHSGGNTNTSSNVSAFNSDAMRPDTSSYAHTDSDANSKTDTNNTNIRTGRAHGNVGVTTSQQMIQSELDLAKWNIYEELTYLFLGEFVIPLY